MYFSKKKALHFKAMSRSIDLGHIKTKTPPLYVRNGVQVFKLMAPSIKGYFLALLWYFLRRSVKLSAKSITVFDVPSFPRIAYATANPSFSPPLALATGKTAKNCKCLPISEGHNDRAHLHARIYQKLKDTRNRIPVSDTSLKRIPVSPAGGG